MYCHGVNAKFSHVELSTATERGEESFFGGFSEAIGSEPEESGFGAHFELGVQRIVRGPRLCCVADSLARKR